MTSIRTNTSAMIALQTLNRTNGDLDAAQGRVSTGLKVQGAKDNAAVWSVAQGQRADKASLDSVTASLKRATSVADVSLAAGEQISDLLVEIKEKATAAADPSATDASRKAYNDEFQSLLKSIDSFAKNAVFDGENILEGRTEANPAAPPAMIYQSGLKFLASADGKETVTLNRQNLTTTGLGLGLDSDPSTVAVEVWTDNAATTDVDESLNAAGIDLLTEEKATMALARVTTALETANSRLASLGAEAKLIERHTTFVSKLSDSLETGIGNLVDADLAKESARLQALQVQQQLGVQALSIANQGPQVILSLFRSS